MLPKLGWEIKTITFFEIDRKTRIFDRKTAKTVDIGWKEYFGSIKRCDQEYFQQYDKILVVKIKNS